MRRPTLDPPTLELHGRFHIPDSVWDRLPSGTAAARTDPVPGELTFNDDGGGSLKVRGHLSRQIPPPLSGEVIDTIHGDSGPKFVALYGCRRTFIDFGDPQHGLVHYSPREILVVEAVRECDRGWGPGFFDDTGSLRCTGFTIRSKLHLQHWIGCGYIEPWPADDTGIDLELPPASSVAEAGTNAELSFHHDKDCVNDPFGCVVEQAALLRISFDEPRRLYGKTGIYHIIRLVHGLVAIAAHKSVAVENITLEFTRDGLPPLHARLYRRWAENESASADPASWQRPVSFELIGGLRGIVKWINAADRYWLPMIRVGSRWLSPTAYLESKFSDVYVALEAIARIKLEITSGSNDLKKQVGGMDKVLQKLATGWGVGDDLLTRGVREDGFERFAQLVGNVERWASAMVRERSTLVIHPGLDCYSRSGELELRPLFEKGYVLAVMCLLHEVGIASDAGRAMCETLARSPSAEPLAGAW